MSTMKKLTKRLILRLQFLGVRFLHMSTMKKLTKRLILRLQFLGLYPVSQPNFFVIGTQKGGTTALHKSLSEHPQIIAPIWRKELHFFEKIDRIDKNEVKRYQREFYPDWIKGKRLSFETTPIYLFREQVPKLIKAYAPSSRLIILLRQPELRALSQWKMARFKHGSENRPFHEVVHDKDSEYVQRGLYAKQILRYLDFFDKQQICIIDSSALLNNPDETLRRIEQFVGVKQGFSPSIKAHIGVKTEEKFTDELNTLRDYYKPHNEELKGLLKAAFELTMSWLEEDS